MKLGIIGLPQSGKTTLYNALTRATQPTGAASGRTGSARGPSLGDV
jgi:Fe2+ transport system protein B